MKGPGNVMLIQKRIQMVDTFIHQEYSSKYVHGGKVVFFYMVGETELSVWNFHINQLITSYCCKIAQRE